MMKRIHAVLRLLICLLVVLAWAKQPSPVFPDQASGAALIEGRLVQADADALLGNVEFSSLEVTQVDGRNL